MKKIILLFCIFIFCIQLVFAGNNKEKDYTVKFNGEKYHLLYSTKDKDFGGYLNEYYKHGETYNIWSELIAVHHFPNAYSPIDRIKEFKNYLGSMNVPSSLTFNDKKNTAMIDFIIITEKKMPVVLEFNIFKYEKSKKCGSIAIQYAKRYSATTTMQIEEIKKDFEKNRKNMIKKLKKFEIPEIINEDIDKCISGVELKNKQEELARKEEIDSAKLEENKEKVEVEIEDTNEKEDTVEKDIQEEQNDDIKAEENSSNEQENVQEEIANSDEKIDTKENNNNDIKEEVVSENESAEEKAEKSVNVVKEEQVSDKSKEEALVKREEQHRVKKEKQSKKSKKNKPSCYQVVNSKDDFYAVPRTKKELKAEIKLNKKKQKIEKKQAKKAAKQRAKEAKLKISQ